MNTHLFISTIISSDCHSSGFHYSSTPLNVFLMVDDSMLHAIERIIPLKGAYVLIARSKLNPPTSTINPLFLYLTKFKTKLSTEGLINISHIEKKFLCIVRQGLKNGTSAVFSATKNRLIN
jgi:hypothetical protein